MRLKYAVCRRHDEERGKKKYSKINIICARVIGFGAHIIPNNRRRVAFINGEKKKMRTRHRKCQKTCRNSFARRRTEKSELSHCCILGSSLGAEGWLNECELKCLWILIRSDIFLSAHFHLVRN